MPGKYGDLIARLGTSAPGEFEKASAELATALLRKADDEAVAALAAAASDAARPDRIRVAALTALQDAGAAATGAVDAISELVRDTKLAQEIRFAAADALEHVNPEVGRIVARRYEEIVDRPRKGPAPMTYQEALQAIAEKQKGEIKYYMLFTLLGGAAITGGIVLVVLAPRFLVPTLVSAGAALAALLAWLFVSSRRCPSCRAFWARGEPQMEGSYQNTTSTQDGGQVTNTVRVYRCRCVRCGHDWRILR
ncbi:MAG: hypothetical protein MUC63_09600 [Planctomycetes bacterium]|nr:hypothetical protein [Planctomycetota bacterium]